MFNNLLESNKKTLPTQVLFVKKITQQMIDDNVFPSLFQIVVVIMVVEQRLNC